MSGKSSFQRKKGRGLSSNKWMNKYPTKFKRKIEFDEQGRPIGKYKKHFSEYLGVMARDGGRFSLTVKEWPKMPQENIDNAIRDIKEFFELPDTCTNEVLSFQLNKNWRDHKYNLKKKYFTNKDKPEKMIPPEVILTQWLSLVEYWKKDEDHQKQAKRNARNRAAMKFPHTLGSKSPAQISDEREMDEFAVAASQSSTDGEFDDSPNDIFSQVMPKERGGRVRLFPSVKPKNLWSQQSSSSTSTKHLEKENAELRNKVEELRSKIEAVDERLTRIVSFFQLQSNPQLPTCLSSSSQGSS